MSCLLFCHDCCCGRHYPYGAFARTVEEEKLFLYCLMSPYGEYSRPRVDGSSSYKQLPFFFNASAFPDIFLPGFHLISWPPYKFKIQAQEPQNGLSLYQYVSSLFPIFIDSSPSPGSATEFKNRPLPWSRATGKNRSPFHNPPFRLS